MKTRLAILGIDGATFDIIRPMIAEGELPHIARVLAEGASSDLESTSPPITPPAWTSMMTGVNPGKHGVYHFLCRQRQTYDLKIADSSLFSGKDIFSILSRRGWTVGGFSVPMTFPPYPVNGYMLSGIPMPMEGSQNVYPEKMWAEITAFLGKPYTPDVDYSVFEGKKEPSSENIDRYEKLRDELFRVERERIDIMVEWLRRDPTEFFFGVISITDRCQHYFWKFMDNTHDGWSVEGERRFKSVIADSYRLADDALGRIREVIGDDCPITLVSDHGFGPYKSDFHINSWLEDEGYLAFKPIPRWTVAGTNLHDLLCRVRMSKIARMLPSMIKKLPIVRPKYKKKRDYRDIDWEQTKAFAALYGVCINLIGREAKGIVRLGNEKKELVADIISRLKKIKNPIGGDLLVDFAKPAEDLFCGKYLELSPDILFMLDGLNCLQNEDIDATEHLTTRKYAAVSGTHRMNGIFAVAGDGVKSNTEFAGMHIQDTAPTLLHMIGEAIPKMMEGVVAVDAFNDDWLHDNQQVFCDIQSDNDSDDTQSWSADETERMKKSLEGLGYL